jgi:CBS domain-containing protein/anti-sigma regulatory factor (Ser/Thr protein kinase)
MKSNKPQIKPYPDSKKYTKTQELVYELKIREVMVQNVVTTTPDISMGELRDILKSNRISGTPVIENDELVGVISVEDLVNWLTEGAEDCPIREKMTTNIDAVYADEPLIHAVSVLDKTGFRRLPVIDRKDKKLVGVITKDGIIEKLLYKLEIDYHGKEIHRHRASYIFEDVIADKVLLTFQSHIKGQDFDRAGQVSSGLKKTLERLGVHPQIVRRAAIASYEAEMNVVIYTNGGDVVAQVHPDQINIFFNDSGPGIKDVEKAMQPGFSTASERIRELGFGAGMGLPNIKKCADRMDLTSVVGKGTDLRISIDIDDANYQSKTG